MSLLAEDGLINQRLAKLGPKKLALPPGYCRNSATPQRSLLMTSVECSGNPIAIVTKRDSCRGKHTAASEYVRFLA